MSNFWDVYGESVEKETSGGPGVIGKIMIDLGYKVYTGDVEQSATFFPVSDPANKDLRKAALAKAKVLANNMGKRTQYGIRITRFKDATIRITDGVWGDVTWSQDLYLNTDAWRTVKNARGGSVRMKNPTTKEPVTVPVEDIPGGKLAFDMVVASLDEAGIGSLPWAGFATLRWMDDPGSVYFGDDGKTDTDQNDKPRYPQVVCISDVYDSLDAARAAVGLETSGKGAPAGDGPAFPEEWAPYPKGWADEMAAIRAEYGIKTKYTGPPPKVKAALEEVKVALEADAENLAANHSCTPADVLAWYSVKGASADIPY